jgi:hypothetical protein
MMYISRGGKEQYATPRCPSQAEGGRMYPPVFGSSSPSSLFACSCLTILNLVGDPHRGHLVFVGSTFMLHLLQYGIATINHDQPVPAAGPKKITLFPAQVKSEEGWRDGQEIIKRGPLQSSHERGP